MIIVLKSDRSKSKTYRAVFFFSLAKQDSFKVLILAISLTAKYFFEPIDLLLPWLLSEGAWFSRQCSAWFTLSRFYILSHMLYLMSHSMKHES